MVVTSSERVARFRRAEAARSSKGKATASQIRAAVEDPHTTIIETRRDASMQGRRHGVKGAYWLPSTTVFAPTKGYQALLSESELDRCLREIGVGSESRIIAT